MRLHNVARRQGNAVTGRDDDMAFQARRLRVAAAVGAAVDHFPALIRRLQPRVVDAEVQRARLAIECQLHALVARLAEIFEVAKTGLVVGHEQDIVVVFRAEHARAPAGHVGELAAHARFPRLRHHLF